MSAYREKIKKQTQRRYFRTNDFDSEKEITLTIERLDEDQYIFESDEPKDLLYFQEDARYLQMNVTNAETLMGLFGDEPSAWAGKKVTLYLTTYETRRGDLKPCIRVKAPGTDSVNVVSTKGATAAASTPVSQHNDMDDEIPF